jgi:predicted DNA binding CopG/RHH family protein
MRRKAGREPFFDPYDDMTDDEFEREVMSAFDRGTTTISLRVPNELLGRTRELAVRRGVPYQSLMKVLIDNGVRRLERVPVRARRRSRPS